MNARATMYYACRELHDEEADAIECCSGDPDAPPPPPPAAELEAADDKEKTGSLAFQPPEQR